MRFRTLILAAVAAATLVPAAASAQNYGGWGYGDYGRYGGYDRRGDDPLAARTERLREWMRRGSREGWLRGWRAERAWGEYRAIREQASSGYGYGRHDLWRRVERLADFVRRAHDEADDN